MTQSYLLNKMNIIGTKRSILKAVCLHETQPEAHPLFTICETLEILWHAVCERLVWLSTTADFRGQEVF